MDNILSKFASVLMQGANRGAEMYGSAVQPAPKDVVEGVLGFTPFVGDAISAHDAYSSLKSGEYGSAALNGLGLLPFVPSLGGVIKNVGNIAKKGLPTELAAKQLHGLHKVPKNEAWDAAGNVFEDMSVKLKALNDGDYLVKREAPWLSKTKSFYATGDSPEELVQYALSRTKRAESAVRDTSLLGMLKGEYGDVFKTANSSQSKSKYITHTPSGTKIRISDHNLPLHYEQPDIDLRSTMDKAAMLDVIKKVLGE